jgi:hypothetical protein
MQRVKIAVVGAGWYGCHIATSLKNIGCEIAIFDSTGFFSGAAFKNQQRLHLGYHYLRSHITRKQAKLGFTEFLAKYGHLTRPVSSNLYAVPYEGTVLDWDTISQILLAEGLPHRLVRQDFNLWSRGLEAVFEVDERVIDGDLSKSFFSKVLAENIHIQQVDPSFFKVLGKSYDFVIDASYSSEFGAHQNSTFEATLIAEFSQTWGTEFFQALTLVDGDLWSIFPTDRSTRRSLSDVKISPLFQSVSENEVQHFIDSASGASYDSQLNLMKEHVCRFIPDLEESLASLRVRFLAKKIKSRSLDARRVSRVTFQDNQMFIHAGKIDAVFDCEREIIQFLESRGAI